MSDATPAPACEDATKLLAAHPLSAHEIAALLRCSLKQALAILHCCWWEVVPVTWDGPGWKYALRATLSRRVNKPSEKVKEFANPMGTFRAGDYS